MNERSESRRSLDAVGLHAALVEACPDCSCEIEQLPVDELVVTLPARCLHRVVALLREAFGVYHLSTITGQDTGTALELLYHFWQGRGVTLRVALPYDAACIPTLTGALPGAAFYEQEIAELVGVTFEGHPNPVPLLLPDTWDEGYPLREGRSEE
jgi:NADH-quinone oxidoreductase subunit C